MPRCTPGRSFNERPGVHLQFELRRFRWFFPSFLVNGKVQKTLETTSETTEVRKTVKSYQYNALFELDFHATLQAFA